jgi:hypothetical protein
MLIAMHDHLEQIRRINPTHPVLSLSQKIVNARLLDNGFTSANFGLIGPSQWGVKP